MSMNSFKMKSCVPALKYMETKSHTWFFNNGFRSLNWVNIHLKIGIFSRKLTLTPEFLSFDVFLHFLLIITREKSHVKRCLRNHDGDRLTMISFFWIGKEKLINKNSIYRVRRGGQSKHHWEGKLALSNRVLRIFPRREKTVPTKSWMARETSNDLFFESAKKILLIKFYRGTSRTRTRRRK